MRHAVVTDDELARARHDPAFRRQLIAENLDHLLTTLARLREASDHPIPDHQMREAAQLAVKLADILQRVGGRPSRVDD